MSLPKTKQVKITVQRGDVLHMPASSVIRNVKVKANSNGGRAVLTCDIPVTASIQIDKSGRHRQHNR